jgi:hypothetical protein
MRLDLNGFPVISHYDPANGDLRLTRCYDPSCVLANTNVVDAGAGEFVGQFTSLQLDSFDTPVISYYNATTGVLKLAHCQDLDCADPASINTVDDTSDMGQYSSLALAQDGNPVISYYDAINGNLVSRCVTPVRGRQRPGDLGRHKRRRHRPVLLPGSRRIRRHSGDRLLQLRRR